MKLKYVLGILGLLIVCSSSMAMEDPVTAGYAEEASGSFELAEEISDTELGRPDPCSCLGPYLGDLAETPTMRTKWGVCLFGVTSHLCCAVALLPLTILLMSNPTSIGLEVATFGCTVCSACSLPPALFAGEITACIECRVPTSIEEMWPSESTTNRESSTHSNNATTID